MRKAAVKGVHVDEKDFKASLAEMFLTGAKPRFTWSPKTGSTNWIAIEAAIESGDADRVSAAKEYLTWYYSIHRPKEGESASPMDSK